VTIASLIYRAHAATTGEETHHAPATRQCPEGALWTPESLRRRREG
jgi:hypothetical protein